MKILNTLTLKDVSPGMTITIPGYGHTKNGLKVARIWHDGYTFKSYLCISFVGGICYNLPRNTEVIQCEY